MQCSKQLFAKYMFDTFIPFRKSLQQAEETGMAGTAITLMAPLFDKDTNKFEHILSL